MGSAKKPDIAVDDAYLACVRDLLANEEVRSMARFVQHGGVDCLEHCLYVSYCSYLVCKTLGLNAREAARGALLHDFFLYDWHGEKPYRGLHAFRHPYVALENAVRCFSLTELEKEIIRHHMWPVTLPLPRSMEALVVSTADKYCAFTETLKLGRRLRVRKLRHMFSC